MPRTKLSAILYLVLVFASGILVGVASTRLYAVKASVAPVAPAASRTMAEFAKRYLEQMRVKVGVNDQQVASISTILADTKKKYDELRREERPTRDRIQQEQLDSIRAVLTDTQKPAFEAWRAERQKEQQMQKQNRAKATTASGAASSAK